MNAHTLNDINPYILYCGFMNASNCPPTGTHFGMRCVKWFEIELILWGEGYILTDGKRLDTDKGKLFFRTPGMLVDGVTPYESYIIYFDAITNPIRIPEYNNKNIYNMSSVEDELRGISFVKSVKGMDLPNEMKVSNIERYRELFDKMHSIFLLNGADSQFFLKSLLLQFLIMAMEEWSYISKKDSTNRSIRNNFPKVLQAKEYIDQNTKKNIKLDQLASIAGLSPSFFCKMFKRITGVSPVTYMNTNKINLAKQLLTKTNMSVKEISLECGLKNETYFFTLFKSQQGLSPLNYREKYGMPNLFVR